MQEITEVAVTITAPRPKKKIEVKRAGNNAITTPYISFFVVSVPYVCGDGDILSRLFMCMIM
jgi:hypothetical protein